MDSPRAAHRAAKAEARAGSQEEGRGGLRGRRAQTCAGSLSAAGTGSRKLWSSPRPPGSSQAPGASAPASRSILSLLQPPGLNRVFETSPSARGHGDPQRAPGALPQAAVARALLSSAGLIQVAGVAGGLPPRRALG